VGRKDDSSGAFGEVKVQKERRRHLRAPIPVRRVGVLGRGNVFFGYAGDISASGMFIRTVNPRKPGDQFTVVFSLPGSKSEIRVTAEVVWAREHSKGSEYDPGMGLKFVDIDEQAAQSIREFVAKGKDAAQ
jgi:uncharacterized protein (TIGR02266 family)